MVSGIFQQLTGGVKVSLSVSVSASVSLCYLFLSVSFSLLFSLSLSLSLSVRAPALHSRLLASFSAPAVGPGGGGGGGLYHNNAHNMPAIAMMGTASLASGGRYAICAPLGRPREVAERKGWAP